MSESRKHGLLRLRLLDEHTEAVAETMAHERARFQRLANKESAPRVVSSHNLFQTPEPERKHPKTPCEGSGAEAREM